MLSCYRKGDMFWDGMHCSCDRLLVSLYSNAWVYWLVCRVLWIGIGGSIFFTALEASKKLYAPRPKME